MGWEKRGSRRYYYEKKRRGTRVFSEYWGCGEEAQIVDQFETANRNIRRTMRDEVQMEQQNEKAIERKLEAVDTLLAGIVHLILLEAGYHKHKGQWRKRRHEKKATASEDTRSVERDQGITEADGEEREPRPGGR
jgi:predicted component of type VI protein secretion system